MGAKKRAQSKKPRGTRVAARKSARAPTTPEQSTVTYGAGALHDLFAQQMRTLLDRTDLDEEQKQAVLLGASCPCCGAGGFSFTAKLKRRT